MYALSPIRVHYQNKPVLNEFMLNKHFFCFIFTSKHVILTISRLFVVWKNKLYQNIAIIISTKCVNGGKCPFNTDSKDHKHPFSLLPSARSHGVKWWHDKSLHITPVNTLSATFIQE